MDNDTAFRMISDITTSLPVLPAVSHSSPPSSSLNNLTIVTMQDVCRDRYGNFPVVLFKLFTCSMCYKYLFHTNNQLTPHENRPWHLVPVADSNAYNVNLSIPADITNQTVKDLVCSSLTDENCSRWTECCHAALQCCQEQLASPKRNGSEGAFCPRTWDGYGCVGDADPGERVWMSCPSYVEHASVRGKSSSLFHSEYETFK